MFLEDSEMSQRTGGNMKSINISNSERATRIAFTLLMKSLGKSAPRRAEIRATARALFSIAEIYIEMEKNRIADLRFQKK